MANLAKLTVVSVEGDLPIMPGSVYLNPARFDSVKTVTISGTTRCQIMYSHNWKGWRQKYAKIIVSDTTANVLAVSGVNSPSRFSVSVTKRGSNEVSPAETESINSKNIVAVIQDSASANVCYALMQSGVWGATWFKVALSAAAFYNLAKGVSNNIVTKVFTIGKPGSVTDDAAFTSAANTTAQNIKFTAALPAFAKLIDWSIVTTAAFTGSTSLGITVGTASAGTQLSTSNDLSAANAVESLAAGASPALAVSASAIDIYVGATPGANWSLVTAGQLKLVLTYVDTLG